MKTGLDRNGIEVVGDEKGRLEGKLWVFAKFQPMRALGNIRIEETANCNGKNSHGNSGLPSRGQDLHVTNYGINFTTDQ